jgi:hypothetical protein
MGSNLGDKVRSDRRAGVILSLAVLVAFAAFWILRPKDGGTIEAHDKIKVEAAPLNSHESQDLQDKSTRKVVADQGVDIVPSIDKSDSQIMLESYFGSDSHEVLALLAGKGIDINTLPAPVPQAEFESFLPNWLAFSAEERAEKHRKLGAWPEKLTNSYLRARFGIAVDLSPDDLAGLDQLATMYAPDIEMAVDQYLDHLEVAMATELDYGRVRTSPFLSWPRGDSSADEGLLGSPFFSIVRAGQGWVAQVSLCTGEHPEALVAREAIQSAIKTRDSDLATSISLLK